MRLRRLVPLALVGLAAWRRLSPPQKAKIRATIAGVGNRTRVPELHGAKP